MIKICIRLIAYIVPVKNPLFAILLLCILLVGTSDQIQAKEDGLKIIITRPSDGETFYAGPTSLVYSMFVTGWVSGSEDDPQLIKVQLEVIQGTEKLGDLVTHPQADGSFIFTATVNPEGSTGDFSLDKIVDCEICHRNVEFSLPAGSMLLRITATDPSGSQGFAERQITVDRSNYASVPVMVTMQDDPEKNLTGIPVSSSTWLYMWRARHATEATDHQGYATLNVEALSEAPTHHIFQVEPVIVDGVLYEGVESIEVILQPGATSAPLVTLTVTSRIGKIIGSFHGAIGPLDESVPITAIHLPDGTGYKPDFWDQSSFIFSELPIGQYLIATDNSILLLEGLYGTSQEVDLAKETITSVEIPLTNLEGNTLRGTIQDEYGSLLPFAWVTPKLIANTQSVQPDTGTYSLHSLPPKSVTLLVSAPGFYSQAQVVDLSSESISGIDMKLARQQETQSLPWGNGEVLVPADTQAEISDHLITLEYGWLWGKGGDTQPFVIRTDSAEIVILFGIFALEYLPGQSAWLCVFDGQAEVRSKNDSKAIIVQTDQMVNLYNDEGLKSVPYDSVVITALRPADDSPLVFIWKPTLGAQIRDQLVRIGVGSAQVVTFITYLVGFIALVLTPVIAIYWWQKNKRPTNQTTNEGRSDNES